MMIIDDDEKERIYQKQQSENQEMQVDQSQSKKQHNHQLEKDELIDESLLKIFEYLDYDDLLIVNRVCKRWSKLACDLTEEKVVVMKKYGDCNKRPMKLFSIPKLITGECMLISYSLVKFRLDKELHKRIKRLVTYNPFILSENLKFDNLINLEVSNSCNCHIEGQNEFNSIEINLKNLKYLNLDLHAHCTFKITAPNLLAAKFTFNFQLVTLVNSKYLKYLHCYKITTQVSLLKNLKWLSIEDLNYDKVTFNLFKRLPKIKKIYLYNVNKKSFDKLMNHKEEQKSKATIYMNGLNVSMHNFQFDYVSRLKEFFDETKYAFYKKNEQHLGGELIQKALRIQNNLNVEMDLFVKFTNIKILNVATHQISFNNWIKILKTLNLNKLFIHAVLSQNYLNQIPKYCTHLRWLSVEDYDNMDFILSCKYLENLEFLNPPSIQEFNQLIDNLKFIHKITFEIYANYSLTFDKRSVVLYFGRRVLLKESRELFINYTLKMIDSWTTLFSQDGSAICS